LTYENSSLGNKPFPQKKGQPGQPKCYASSSVLIEREIAGFSDWTPETIQQRRIFAKNEVTLSLMGDIFAEQLPDVNFAEQ
jgi:hypothetical protein